jgi:hypothetical protein
MLDDGDHSVIARDDAGQLRFHADLHNADALRERLAGFPEAEAATVLDAYEDVFDHKSFTGRSGTMYGYEGIGCIYWHMVAKLLLAVQELALRADREGDDPAIRDALFRHYHRVRDGLGFRKTPEEYGAFPVDPYSHTPPDGNARQPGMTGQVKEEILTRFGELGVAVEAGRLSFRPRLLREDEFSREPSTFRHVDPEGAFRDLPLPAGSLGFTLAGTPVVYRLGDAGSIRLWRVGNGEAGVDGTTLAEADTAALLARDGSIERVEVTIPGDALFRP